jgi:hypothetical protein
VATRYTLARMGAELSSVYARKGTMRDVLARCLKKTYVQVCILSSVYVLFCNEHSRSCYIHTSNCCLLLCTSCVCVITGVYFSQVKNKPWIPWVYAWFWHRHEKLQPLS